MLAFEPPERVVIAWHLNEAWQFDPDPEHASEVEIRFIVEGPDATRVEVKHRGFERHGAGAEGVRGGVDNPQGWWYCLESFSKALA